MVIYCLVNQCLIKIKEDALFTEVVFRRCMFVLLRVNFLEVTVIGEDFSVLLGDR